MFRSIYDTQEFQGNKPKFGTLKQVRQLVFCLGLAAFAIIAKPMLAQAQENSEQLIGIYPDEPNPDLTDFNLSLSEVNKEGSELNKTAKALGKRVQSGWEKLHKEAKEAIGRLSIPLSIPLLRFSIGDDGDFDSHYRFLVEPAFSDGIYLRKDIWSLGASVGKYGGLEGGVAFTYIRRFSGPDAQKNAVFAKPYCVVYVPLICADDESKLPRNTTELLKKLKIGDQLRAEIRGGLFLRSSINKLASQVKTKFWAKFARSGLFIADIYRHDENIIRTRYLALKNRGRIEASGRWSWVPTFLPDEGLYEKIANQAVNVGFRINFLKDFNFIHEYPTDTLLVDYLYNLDAKSDIGKEFDSNNITSTAALNEALKALFDFEFRYILDPSESTKDIALKLINKTNLSRNIALDDFRRKKSDLIKYDEMRVRTLFKGYISSKFFKFSLGGTISLLASAKSQPTSLEAFVENYDEEDQVTNYLLRGGTDDNQYKLLAGAIRAKSIREIDLLVTATPDGQPIAIKDVVIRNRHQDSDFDKKNILTYRDRIMGSLPTYYSTGENGLMIADYFPHSDLKAATLDFRYNYGEDAFMDITRFGLNRNELYKRLYSFLDNHPDRSSLKFPISGRGQVDIAINGANTFEEYVNNMYFRISDLIHPNTTPVERLRIFEELMRDENFRSVIIGEFFSSLVSDTAAKNSVGIQLNLTAKGRPSNPQRYGEFQGSDVYNAVNYLRSVMESQPTDLRLETILDTNGVVVTSPNFQ